MCDPGKHSPDTAKISDRKRMEAAGGDDARGEKQPPISGPWRNAEKHAW